MYISGQVFIAETFITLYIYITANLLIKNNKKYKENYMIKI